MFIFIHVHVWKKLSITTQDELHYLAFKCIPFINHNSSLCWILNGITINVNFPRALLYAAVAVEMGL